MDVFDLFAKITLDSSEYEKGLETAKSKGLSVSNDFGTKFTSGIEKGVKTLAKWGAAAGGALTAAGGYAIKVGGDFEAGMSQVAAISGATGDDLQKLTDLAKEMGAKTKFSATEAAEGYQYMAMAGWKTEDMLNGLPGIMNLAAASGEDLGTTSDIVTDALTAMGLSAGDSAHFADVLAAASSNSNTNVSMMGETFKYAAPLAGALGYNIEDLAQAIGLMANSGIKSTQAGTSLRSILTRLADPPKDCAAAMEQYGISMTNSDGTMKSLMEVMENMRDSLGSLDEQEQASAASAIGGQEAMSGLLAIVNASESDFDKLAAAIDNSDGSAEKMAETMQDNLQGKITILKSALEGVGIAAFEKFQKPLEDAVDKVTEAVSNFDLDAFLQKLQDVLSYVQKFAPVIAAVGGAIGGLYASIKAMQIAKDIANLAAQVQGFFAFLAANPLVAIVAVIASIIAYLVTLYNTNEDFRNKVNEVWTSVKETVSNVVGAIGTFFTQTIPDAISNVIEWFQQLPERISEFLSNAIQSIVDWATQTAENARQAGSDFINAVVEFFSQLPYNLGVFLGTSLANIVIWAAETAENARQAGSQFLQNVVEFFTQLPGNVLTFLSTTIQNVIAWAGQMNSNAIDAASTFLNNVIEFFTQLPGKIAEWFTKTIEKVVEWAEELRKNGEQAAKDLLDAVVTGLEELPGKIFDLGVNAAKSLLEGIKSMGGWLKEQVGNFVDGMVSGFTGTVQANGSHAGGMDYVPYNNYVANLHRGEMVLTSAEATAYRKGETNAAGGMTFNIDINGIQFTDVNSMAHALVNQISYELQAQSNRKAAIYA